MPDAKFELGQVMATPGALRLAEEYSASPHDLIGALLKRHQSGDWGLVDDEDAATNDQAVIDGDRILSVYNAMPDNNAVVAAKLWIITEANRAATTVLLPEDY